MNRFIALLAATFIGVFAAACTGSAAKIECASITDCAEQQICADEGVCEDVDCVDSEDCDVGEYCTDDHECEDGCADDGDCPAGERCDDNECEPYGCRDTQLDCEYGQFCDQVTGQCYDSDFQECTRTCDLTVEGSCGGDYCLATEINGSCNYNYGGTDCPSGNECVLSAVDEASFCFADTDCQSGYHCAFDFFVCVQALCAESKCFEACDVGLGDEACPRGFQCIDPYGNGSPPVCIGECEIMEEYLR